MSIRIGVAPLSWSNDDMPRLGEDISLERCLREARQAGYEGIELGHKFPRQAAALRAALTPHQLALVSGWYSARLLERDVEQEIAGMAPHLQLLHAMDCRVVVVCEVSGSVHTDRSRPLGSRPQMSADEWRRLGQRLTALAEHTQERGVRLAYHHHMGTVIQSYDDVVRLMEGTGDAVGLVLDSGHAVFAEADPLRFVGDYGDRIVHVHCKDVRPEVLQDVRQRDTSFLDAVVAGCFTVPGDGAIEFAPLLAALRREAYQGWLVVEAEQDPRKADPLQYASLGYQTLAALVAAQR
jgi:inosose dehydratase